MQKAKSISVFEHRSPYREGYLDTGDGHEIYFACFGNPKGKPIINLHGGPGYGSEIRMISFFDPQHWNILLFDQRGAGRSRPIGAVHNNTTQHLINDINLLADHVGFRSFVIKGESWGTTLALAYAQSCPHRLTSMILIGVFLGEKGESLINKIDGIQRHFPDLWCQFIGALPENDRSNPFDAYYRYIFEGTEKEKQRFAKESIVLEIATEAIGQTRAKALADCEIFDFLNVARIEYHYLINNFFLTPGQILEGCEKISNISTSIIHGRYDMICPPESAWKLSRKLKKCELFFADPAGHSENELVTTKVLLKIAKKHLKTG